MGAIPSSDDPKEGLAMNRLEKFKQRRDLRKKYFLAAFLFLFFLTAGLFSADQATNSLMSGRQGIAFAEWISQPAYLEIVIMNQKIHINTQYINRDLKRLEGELRKLFGAGERADA
jgi:hypothetical protein